MSDDLAADRERPSDERVRRRRWRLVAAASLLAIPWAAVAGSLFYFEDWPPGCGLAAMLAWLIAPVALTRRLGDRNALVGCTVFGLVWFAFFLARQRPRTDRQWLPDQDRTVVARFEADGHHVVVENLRDSRHRSLADHDLTWTSRRLDLQAVRSVDFVIEPLPPLPGLAHALLSFGFDDGTHLVVSAEVRREVGETYSPLAGLFRRYELIYVVGDERDLLGLRLDARGHELIVHPLRAEREQASRLLRSMLVRAEALGREPEFYNSFSKTCTTSLVRHLEELRGEPLPFAWQVHLPLAADEVAWELGLLGDASSLPEARRRHRVVGPSPALEVDGPTFARWLRARR